MIIDSGKDISEVLIGLADAEYKNFQSALIPGVPKEKIIGVRLPILKKLAKEMIKNGTADAFISRLPHDYYDEDNLHAFIIAEIRDFEKLMLELERFIPYIDNWATCDSLRPKAIKSNAHKAIEYCHKWINSDEEFVTRFGIEMLMVYFSDEFFDSDDAVRIAEIKNEKYYVKMMIAWYFATLLSKRWDNVIEIFESRVLDKFVHNKAIQKSVESLRLSAEQKTYLKELKKQDLKY